MSPLKRLRHFPAKDFVYRRVVDGPSHRRSRLMTLSRLAAASLAIALLAGAAIAQPADNGGGGVRQACAADLQKLCPDAKPGPGGGMRECVKAHFSELSKPCQGAIMSMRARMQQQGGGNATAS
jgi:hypothetical protein